MRDTHRTIADRVVERHRAMTAEQRLRAASGMFDAAQRLIDASLPHELTVAERRLARARRIYENELPPAALSAHANWPNLKTRNRHALDPR